MSDLTSNVAVQTVDPIYAGDNLENEENANYGPGYVGFSFTEAWISRGITYFTRWDRYSDVKVSHALIVVSETECIEAVMVRGVIRSKMTKYFGVNNKRVFFRKPKGLTPELAQAIVKTAESQDGAGYDNRLMLANLMNGSMVGHAFNVITKGASARFINKIFDGGKNWICSEFAGHCLSQQTAWPYHNQGSLSHSIADLSPQKLFEDEVIFTPWKPKKE